MSFLGTTEFFLEVAKGNVPGHRMVHKFGSNDAVGNTLEPITQGGIYPVPQVGSATTLRIKAGDANDDAAGTGAREITLEGLDETGNLVTETLATAGASPSGNTTATFMRLFRAYVSASGTYANATTGSHADDIVIEESAGANDWLTIILNSFPRSQSEVGVYTVPVGESAYILSALVTTDSGKTTEILLFRRNSILATSPPYDAMREIYTATTKGSVLNINPRAPMGPFAGPMDIGWMAKVDSGNAVVSVDYEILLVAD